MSRKKELARRLLNLALLGIVFAAGFWFMQQRRETILSLQRPHVREAYAWYPKLRQIDANAPAPSRRSSVDGVPVLLYHGLASQRTRGNVAVSQFREQMATLRKAGYEAITLAEFDSFMHRGTPLPAKPVLITLDNPSSDAVLASGPILGALRFHATVFIDDSRIRAGDPSYFAADEVRRMAADRTWDVGSQITSATAGLNLSTSRHALQAMVRQPVICVSLPSSRSSSSMTSTIERARSTYRWVFVRAPGQRDFTYSYRLQGDEALFNRILVQPGMTGADLIGVLESGAPVRLPVDLTGPAGSWRGGGGAIRSEYGRGFTLTALSGRSANFLADGTRGWVNYTTRLRSVVTSGTQLTLEIRKSRDNDGLAVVFDPKRVRMFELKRGKRHLLAQRRGRFGHYVNARVSVQGDLVRCELPGRAASFSARTSIADGGLAIRAGASNGTGVARAEVTELWVSTRGERDVADERWPRVRDVEERP